jgi:ATP-dependent DNA helicase RecQ
MPKTIRDAFFVNYGYITEKGTLIKVTGYGSDERSLIVKRLDTGEENIRCGQEWLDRLTPLSQIPVTKFRTVALQPLRLATNNPNAEFRDDQWDAIENLLVNNSRQLVVQRTGWGKSMVYFLTTLLLRLQGKGSTLLISPLLALMRNQIESAQRLDVKAAAINTATKNDWDDIQQRLLANQIDVLLISPERLANDDFLNNVLLQISDRVGLFVVDEAHCISDWGHDFRPDYQRIVRILQALPPNISVLATTATANNRVIQDIKTQLGSSLQISRGSLIRESLQLQNIWLPKQESRLAWLAENIPNLSGSGIVYALTAKDTEIVTDWLRLNNINASFYHGQLVNEVRKDLEDRLLDNQVKVLVATNALGMGFDKPDLGFVIHYQRPSSIVHYYQQVGRAGRGISKAYGILLSGDEDTEITDFFIRAAFPPEGHITQVLAALRNNDGLSVKDLQNEVNLSEGQIKKVLKILAIKSPSPVSKQNSEWYLTAIPYQPDLDKVRRITEIRQAEQSRMLEYMQSDRECLMMFLARELDDPSASTCGSCAICLEMPVLPTTYSQESSDRATEFLKDSKHIIEPRKQIPSGAMPKDRLSGNLHQSLQAENGRALCKWGNSGWGELIKNGKYQAGYFDDALVDATANMIQRWHPEPFPTWVTCVPSLNRPNLVPNFAQRLATKLGLPFASCVQKVQTTPPQKEMNNSYQQAHNLDGAFTIDRSQVIQGAVFLVDDMVDSRSTFTIISALLRRAGSSVIFPVALAVTSQSSDG